DEAAVRGTALDERVGIELQLEKALEAELDRVAVMDGPAEPERRPDARYRNRAVRRQLDVPRDVLRGARRRRDRIELGLVVPGADGLVVLAQVVLVGAQAARDVREAGGGARTASRRRIS